MDELLDAIESGDLGPIYVLASEHPILVARLGPVVHKLAPAHDAFRPAHGV